MSPEGEAVMEDGLGPEDVGNSSPDSDNCGPPEAGSLARTKSTGFLSGNRISPVSTSLKFAELSDKQKEHITFPARTFDYLRDDIRQTIIDLINFKIVQEKLHLVSAPDDGPDVSSQLKPDEASKPVKLEATFRDSSIKVPTLKLVERKRPVLSPTDTSATEKRGELSIRRLESQENNARDGDGVGLVDPEQVEGGGGRGKFESFVLVHNVAKRHNLGTLARSATAFGVSELILVGRKDFNAFGSHGATLHLQFRHFQTLAEARQYLKVRA